MAVANQMEENKGKRTALVTNQINKNMATNGMFSLLHAGILKIVFCSDVPYDDRITREGYRLLIK